MAKRIRDLRTHRPLQEGLRPIQYTYIGSSGISEPIVHYKKDCDKKRSPTRGFRGSSEPIVHYKKDCDFEVDDQGFRHLAPSEPIVHYKKDCDTVVCRDSSRATSLRTHRPLQEGLRLFLYLSSIHILDLSEPIVHYKKDCDSSRKTWRTSGSSLRTHRPLQEGLRLSTVSRSRNDFKAQNPSSTTRRIATLAKCCLSAIKYLSQNPSSTTRRIATRGGR